MTATLDQFMKDDVVNHAGALPPGPKPRSRPFPGLPAPGPRLQTILLLGVISNGLPPGFRFPINDVGL